MPKRHSGINPPEHLPDLPFIIEASTFQMLNGGYGSFSLQHEPHRPSWLPLTRSDMEAAKLRLPPADAVSSLARRMPAPALARLPVSIGTVFLKPAQHGLGPPDQPFNRHHHDHRRNRDQNDTDGGPAHSILSWGTPPFVRPGECLVA